MWVLKERGDRLAKARFSSSVSRDQINDLVDGKLSFREEPIKCEEVAEVEEDQQPKKRLKTQTIEELCLPWKTKPYATQLQDKRKIVIDAMQAALKGVEVQAKSRGYSPLPAWDSLVVEKTIHIPPVDGEPVPGYRNKCEFTFACNAAGEPDIGFMHSRATNTSEPVVAAGENLMHVSLQTRSIVESLRELLRYMVDKYPLFSHLTKQGCWRMTSIRACPITGNSQVILQSGPMAVSDRIFFEAALTKWAESISVTSLFVQYNSSVTDTIALSELHEMKLLFGPESISMGVGDLRFQVHPLSFFQTNSHGCDLLYGRVRDEASSALSANGVCFDVCCGVGTIGQYVASSTTRVIGVDIVEEAIENAKRNAELNNLADQCEYVAGRAEHVLPSIIAATAASSIVAIVDPPRSGLHKSVISAIRENEAITTLIYVSCNPKTMSDDLVKFCEPLISAPEEEGVAVNRRFIPSKAVAVDMFPNTLHCEVVVTLTRDPPTL